MYVNHVSHVWKQYGKLDNLREDKRQWNSGMDQKW